MSPRAIARCAPRWRSRARFPSRGQPDRRSSNSIRRWRDWCDTSRFRRRQRSGLSMPISSRERSAAGKRPRASRDPGHGARRAGHDRDRRLLFRRATARISRVRDGQATARFRQTLRARYNFESLNTDAINLGDYFFMKSQLEHYDVPIAIRRFAGARGARFRRRGWASRRAGGAGG